MTGRESKVCASCGRRFEWRKKWERDWASVKYCADSCRRRGVSDEDRALEDAILDLLANRSIGSSICPSEAARSVGDHDWKNLMEPARRAARRLAHAEQVEITQGGKPVDPSEFRGPIRIRLRR